MNEKVAWVADNMWDLRWYIVVLVVGFGLGLYSQPKHVCPTCPTTDGGVIGDTVKTFIKVNAEDVANMSTVEGLCQSGGKPIIRMFSTSWCPHCLWAGPTFEEVARENADKAIFEHWDVETGDNSLTLEVETAMGMGEYTMYEQLSGGSIPTYTFGCQYYRVGNVYEQQDDLVAEKRTFQDGVDLVAGAPTGLLGGDKDEHGCIGSAGYSWCEAKQKCLRAWEETCE